MDPGHRAGGVCLSGYILFAAECSKGGLWEPSLPSPHQPPAGGSHAIHLATLPRSRPAVHLPGHSLMGRHFHFRPMRRRFWVIDNGREHPRITQESQQSSETARVTQRGPGMIPAHTRGLFPLQVLWLGPKNIQLLINERKFSPFKNTFHSGQLPCISLWSAWCRGKEHGHEDDQDVRHPGSDGAEVTCWQLLALLACHPSLSLCLTGSISISVCTS